MFISIGYTSSEKKHFLKEYKIIVLNYKIETLLGHFPLNSKAEKGRRPASLLHAHSFPGVPTVSSALLALELGEGESL